MFSSSTSSTSLFSPQSSTVTNITEVEVNSPPEDSVSCLKFSPEAITDGTFIIGTSWAGDVRCWQVDPSSGSTIPKAQKVHGSPILSACWSTDGQHVFTAGCDNAVRMWSLASDQYIQVAAHDAPVKTVHFIQRPTYSCIMTGSWDRNLKFWDLRSSTPQMKLSLSERIYCADVVGPMAVVGTSDRKIYVYNLDNQPTEFSHTDSPLKYQHRCVAIFQHNDPKGYALGSIEGRVAIQYVNSSKATTDNFTFKCHRSATTTNSYQEIYAVNDLAFHPIHGTLATVGSDGKYSFWDKDSRAKLKTPDTSKDLPLTCCAFDAKGQLFAYAASYDWHRGHEGNDINKKNRIYLRQVFEDMKPRQKT